jgi:hypothetical protein
MREKHMKPNKFLFKKDQLSENMTRVRRWKCQILVTAKSSDHMVKLSVILKLSIRAGVAARARRLCTGKDTRGRLCV